MPGDGQVMKNIRINGFFGGFQKPYIVAEMNSSHMGKIDNAKAMVVKAKEIGCSAVKFQSWTAESLYSADYYRTNPMAKRMVSGFSLSEDDLKNLSLYCRELGIDFSSTPYSNREVDFLVDECKAKFIKIASMDLNNIGFLRYIAKKGAPIVLSTGMGSKEEIIKAVKTIQDAGNEDICVLHCVSQYPTNVEDINLNNLNMLMDLFPGKAVGLSDHTIGCEAAIASVAMGAYLIEKHFTLNSKKIGWDNQMATEPEEFAVLVEKCNQIYKAMGSYERIITPAELEQKQKMRRSFVAACNISAGQVITEDLLDRKRPQTGIPVDHLEAVVGKTALCDIEKGCIIFPEQLGGAKV